MMDTTIYDGLLDLRLGAEVLAPEATLIMEEGDAADSFYVLLQGRVAIEQQDKTIAELGLRGVTHREVARRAEVQLSLTTYYFADIEELMLEAFALFSTRSRPGYEQAWSGIFDYLESFSRSDLRRTDVKEAVCEGLAQRATDYLVAQIMEKPIGLAVEQNFFTAARLSPDIQTLAEEHRANLLKPLVSLCGTFNRNDPEVDAELLLDVITTLEYAAMSMPRDDFDSERLKRLIRRQVGWAMGIRRA